MMHDFQPMTPHRRSELVMTSDQADIETRAEETIRWTPEAEERMIRAARESIVSQWEAEIARYRAAGLVLTPVQNKEFFDQAEKALAELRRPLQ